MSSLRTSLMQVCTCGVSAFRTARAALAVRSGGNTTDATMLTTPAGIGLRQGWSEHIMLGGSI